MDRMRSARLDLNLSARYKKDGALRQRGSRADRRGAERDGWGLPAVFVLLPLLFATAPALALLLAEHAPAFPRFFFLGEGPKYTKAVLPASELSEPTVNVISS